MGYIDHVGFDHNSAGFPIYKPLVQSSYGSIVAQPVITSHDAEAQNMPLLVQNLQSLCAGGRRETGNDSNLSQAADLEIPTHEAISDKVLIDLRLVESPNQRPDNAYRCLHSLYHHG